MKNKKIIINIALMTISAVLAYSQQYSDEKDFRAERDPYEDGIMISEYIGLKGEVSIPPSIQKVTVTGIKPGAFRNKSLTKVTIPNTVKWIGDDAFQGNRFTTITIPNSVVSIGDEAFYNCKNLTSVTFQGKIPWDDFEDAFEGDLIDKYFADNGGPGTYTRLADDNIWRNPRQATAPQSSNSGKLVIWSFTDELKYMIESRTWGFKATHPKNQVEYSQTPSDQFQSKLDPVLASGRGTPDIIALESAFVRKYVESGLLLDITDIYEAYKSKLLAYPVEIGSYKGKVYALSWQACPGAMFYRRSLARKYLGTDDPRTVQTYFTNFMRFLDTAQLLKQKSNGSCVVISSLGDLRNPFLAGRTQSWLVNGKVVIDPVMEGYMDICKTLHDNRLEGRVGQWSEGWFAGMRDELRDEYGRRAEVFSYFLPTWGLHYVLKTNAPYTAGDWAMIQGPTAYRWGGTWVGAYKGTKNVAAVKEFIRYITTDDAFLEAWAKDTGDMITNINVINKIKDTYSEPYLGGQNHYAAFAEIAKNVNGKLLQGSDEAIEDMFDEATGAYVNGEKSKAQALADFRRQAESHFGR
jgi:ABC-type glycerol-3-phosphate transport system substrate-binding protein